MRPPDIETFLAAGPFAVVGASPDRAKYGNKVLRCYQQHGLTVVPINPKQTEVEGLRCFPSLAAATPKPRSVSVVAPPAAAAGIVADAIAAGVRGLWFQPGAEEAAAIAAARAAGLTVIADGACVLVVLGYREH
ncbi:MAG: CoA-binding protein [Planctomycetes bacterium]|nr:CoA-binding protein [Planctomycetota bacterium]